ncbi:MAG: penicillin-binding transpeptidase domain-containing protein, partial [Candidatus Omnitrophota bacterium]
MFRARQYVVFFFLIFLFGLLFLRLFYLQVLSFDRFSDMASGQHNQIIKIEPRRGTIFDRYKEPLAINLEMPSVYGNPRVIEEGDKEKTAGILAEVLDLDKEEVLQRLEKDKAFVWIKRKISPKTADKLKSFDLSGVYFLEESKRNYPNDSMASQILGFVGMDNEGLEGLELMFDGRLKGEPGWRHLIRDARRREVLLNEKESIPPDNGNNIILTIDSVIQYIVEEELERLVNEFNASGASAVVMNPFTGEILALANYPDYNLNAYQDAPREFMKNPVVANVFEPGSVFKIVTASAALNEGIIGLEDKVDCENGEYNVGGRILHDYHKYGVLTFRELIVKSSNIGTVKVAMELGAERVYEYIKKFGFGEKTGVDLPGEVSGINRSPSVWSRSDITTIPMGQGIAVTAMQLACAMSVIANGG